MNLSIRGKILALLILLVVVAVGVATWLNIRSSLNARREEIQERAQDVGEFVGLLFKDQLLKDMATPHQKRKLVKSWLENKNGIHFLTVYNSSGKQIFTTQSVGTNPPPSSNLTDRFIQEALNSDAEFITRELTNRQVYDFLVPVQLFEINFGLVRVGFDATRFYSNRNEIIQQSAIFGLMILLGVTVLGYFFTDYLVKPIQHLESVARRFGRGDLSVRSDVQSGDEIQHLSTQFNTMAGRIEQQIEDLRTIEKLNRKISARLRPEKLYDRITKLIENTWDIPYIALVLNDGSHENYQIAAGLNVSTSTPPDTELMLESLNELTRITEEFPHDAEETRRQVSASVRHLFDHDRESFSDVLAFELDNEDEDQEFGYLIVAKADGEFSTSQINLLQTLTHQIKIAVQNAKNYQRAVTDDLTGLYTRRFFEMELDKEINAVSNTPSTLSLAMIDIDNFKEYNDTYGHPEGDIVLRELANVFLNQIRSSDLRRATRKTDTLARYGGEEFAIILPSTDLEGGREVGQRIVERVASIESFKEQVTVSMGVAEYESGETKRDFIKRADDALYEAKDQGKNRVVTAE